LVNEALRIPGKAINDATIAAVLILAVEEVSSNSIAHISVILYGLVRSDAILSFNGKSRVIQGSPERSAIYCVHERWPPYFGLGRNTETADIKARTHYKSRLLNIADDRLPQL
jgi:hypothetical protein